MGYRKKANLLGKHLRAATAPDTVCSRDVPRLHRTGERCSGRATPPTQGDKDERLFSPTQPHGGTANRGPRRALGARA